MFEAYTGDTAAVTTDVVDRSPSVSQIINQDFT